MDHASPCLISFDGLEDESAVAEYQVDGDRLLLDEADQHETLGPAVKEVGLVDVLNGDELRPVLEALDQVIGPDDGLESI
jgi:hypothetical protein